MKMLHKSKAQIIIQYLPLVSFALKFAHHNTTTSSLVSSAIIQWHDIKQMLRQSCKLPILSKNLLLMKLSTIYLDQIVDSNLLAVWWAGRKMRLKMIELLQEVLLGLSAFRQSSCARSGQRAFEFPPETNDRTLCIFTAYGNSIYVICIFTALMMRCKILWLFILCAAVCSVQ